MAWRSVVKATPTIVQSTLAVFLCAVLRTVVRPLKLKPGHPARSGPAGQDAIDSGRGGYSLLEVVAAFVVLTIGVIGCFGFFTHGAIMLNVENHRRTAAEIAHSRQEVLRTVAPASLPSYAEDDYAVDIDGLAGERDTVIADVDEDEDEEVDYRRVTVTVSWPEKGTTQAVSLVTLRCSYR